MDAAGDEQAVQLLVGGALHVGADAVADAEDTRTVHRPAEQGLGLRQRHLIDRRKGLSGHPHHTAEGLVELGQGAAAVDQLVAPLHHLVRVGADHGQLPRRAGGQGRAVILGGLDLVVIGPGAGDEHGLVGADELYPQALVQRPVPIRADLPGRTRRQLGQQLAGGVARTDERPPRRARHAQAVQLFVDVHRRPGRIGDQDHRPDLGVVTGQRRAGVGETLPPVMDHPPDVAEQDVILSGEVGQSGDQLGRGHARRVAGDGGGVNLRPSPGGRRRGPRLWRGRMRAYERCRIKLKGRRSIRTRRNPSSSQASHGPSFPRRGEGKSTASRPRDAACWCA